MSTKFLIRLELVNKLILALLLSVSSAFSLYGQEFRDSISSVSDFNIDPFGNCYYLKGTDIIKINNKGKELVRYSVKNIGAPSTIDVSNPMRILIFYADFATVRILDNNLIDQSEIDLREINVLQPRVMAGTPDQGIWVYDEISGSLIKIDTKLKTSAFSVDLNQLLGRRPNPTLLLATQEWIIMKDTKELLIFDPFGSKVRSIALLSEPNLIQLKENLLLFNNKNELITYNLRINAELKENSICPLSSTKCLVYERKCWYILNKTLYVPQ